MICSRIQPKIFKNYALILDGMPCSPNTPAEERPWRSLETSFTDPVFPTPGAAQTPSAFSYPEPLVGRGVPGVKVTNPGLWDRASPYVKLEAGNVSTANL